MFLAFRMQYFVYTKHTSKHECKWHILLKNVDCGPESVKFMAISPLVVFQLIIIILEKEVFILSDYRS